MRRLRQRVIRNNVFNWAERFIEILSSVEAPRNIEFEPFDVRAVADQFSEADSRLLILDYDGTLVGIDKDPTRTAPGTQLLAVLTELAADPRNTVAVVSGRRSSDLDKWLGSVPNLVLAAEHGAMVRQAGTGEWKSMMPPHSNLDWKENVRDLFQHFVDRAPGSFIEEKEYAIVWHYRRVEAEFGEWLAGELTALIGGLLAETDANATRGRKIVEVRPNWANKGAFTSTLLAEHSDASFVLAIGDDLTDEDMFEQVGPNALTFHVGRKYSRARHSLPDPAAVLQLLRGLAQASTVATGRAPA